MKTTKSQSILSNYAIVGLVAAGLNTPMHLGATDKSGTIFGETWTKAESPYHITGDILVVGLTIQPGASIYFDNNYVFEVAGALHAVGSEPEPILFTQTNGMGGWQGVYFNYGAPGSELAYCRITGSINSGVRANYTPVSIRNCVLANNSGSTGAGISIVGTTSEIYDTVIVSNSAAAGGGGLRLTSSSALVTNCLIVGNSAQNDGAGIQLSASSCRLLSSVVSTNQANGNGGAFAATASDAVVSNCTFVGNSSVGLGGAVCIDNRPSVSVTNASGFYRCTVAFNISGSEGGGIWLRNANRDWQVEKCTITRNKGVGAGGGMVAGGSGTVSLSGTSVDFNECTGPGNVWGGGIYADGPTTISGGTISSNTCSAGNHAHGGGGVLIGPSVMNRCLVIGNSIGGFDTQGGGLQSGNFLFMTNCIIAANNAVGLHGDRGYMVNTTIAYNGSEGVRDAYTMVIQNSILFFNNGGGVQIIGTPTVGFSDVQNGYAGDGNINRNPIFISPTDYLLYSASPCIDAGNTNSIYDDACFPPSQGAVRNDMGAYGGPGACDWITGDVPLILGNPKSQKSCIGMSVDFSVRAIGAPPLNYQWFFNGTNLLVGQTSTNLSLTDVQKNQSGLYSCVVSNSFGTAESLPAALIVYDACVDIHMYAGLSIGGKTGNTYVVSYTKDVNTNSAWTALATNTLTTNFWFYVDTESAWDPMRFYRVDLHP
ncbi:MAG: hypothetical protein HOP33_10125 [Verrucomicrobia bacterium]|nr:hypothetical protein [Verrucomicrobiota bacterium]